MQESRQRRDLRKPALHRAQLEKQIGDAEIPHIAVAVADSARNDEDVSGAERILSCFQQVNAFPAVHDHHFDEIVRVHPVVRMEEPRDDDGRILLPAVPADPAITVKRLSLLVHNHTIAPKMA
ncbi:hypothetical protein SDC9_178733 [bioreactor metagenome]|uniref:Uncharacterized protein n=1 Tax=bioreactor metagenome TaxID=1076179 RepID=A0A645GZU6_9ZZZZ